MELTENYPELNPLNYDESDVLALHAWAQRAYDALALRAAPVADGDAMVPNGWVRRIDMIYYCRCKGFLGIRHSDVGLYWKCSQCDYSEAVEMPSQCKPAPPAGQGATAERTEARAATFEKWLSAHLGAPTSFSLEDMRDCWSAARTGNEKSVAWMKMTESGPLLFINKPTSSGFTLLYQAPAHGERQLDWSTVRSIMAQGADIQKDYMAGNHASYEAYAARMDAAAHERLEGLTAESISPGKRALAEMLLRQSAPAHGEREPAPALSGAEIVRAMSNNLLVGEAHREGERVGFEQGIAEGLERAAKVCDAHVAGMKAHMDPSGTINSGPDMFFSEIMYMEALAADIRALAAPAKQPEGGFVMVPREMTIDMEIAFCEAWFSKRRCIDDAEMQDAYAAMLAALPAAAVLEGE